MFVKKQNLTCWSCDNRYNEAAGFLWPPDLHQETKGGEGETNKHTRVVNQTNDGPFQKTWFFSYAHITLNIIMMIILIISDHFMQAAEWTYGV